MKLELAAKRLTSAEALYLKRAGRLQGTKVSVGWANGEPVLHIRDYEFATFDKALLFLQHTNTELEGPV